MKMWRKHVGRTVFVQTSADVGLVGVLVATTSEGVTIKDAKIAGKHDIDGVVEIPRFSIVWMQVT